jgi:hypothetical protein
MVYNILTSGCLSHTYFCYELEKIVIYVNMGHVSVVTVLLNVAYLGLNM